MPQNNYPIPYDWKNFKSTAKDPINIFFKNGPELQNGENGFGKWTKISERMRIEIREAVYNELAVKWESHLRKYTDIMGEPGRETPNDMLGQLCGAAYSDGYRRAMYKEKKDKSSGTVASHALRVTAETFGIYSFDHHIRTTCYTTRNKCTTASWYCTLDPKVRSGLIEGRKHRFRERVIIHQTAILHSRSDSTNLL